MAEVGVVDSSRARARVVAVVSVYYSRRWGFRLCLSASGVFWGTV